MKKLIIGNTIGILFLAAFGVWMGLSEKKQNVVYVDSIKLFNAYQFKKEMYAQIEQSFGSQMARMDSLEQVLSSGQADEKGIRQFEEEREELSYKISGSKSETDRVIWERLNQVIKRFGDTQNYELIIGANGMGTVLYGQPFTDITEAVTKYANTDYEGK